MYFLLAQSAAPALTPVYFLVLAAFGLGGIAILILVPLVIYRYQSTSRQLQHAERIKAIEAEYPLEVILYILNTHTTGS